ncbi:MAG: amidohydrolase family protein [Phycisphaeraceae bacterium]|nr:amidohydrolase family protein [Phycisphaeraceae bacterium]
MSSRLLFGLYSFVGLLVGAVAVAGQPTSNSALSPPPNGMVKQPPDRFVLIGATAHVAPGVSIADAWVEIAQGRIVSVTDGAGRDPARIAGGARVIDYTGRHIYPGFIDAFVEIDVPAPAADAPGTHWNGAVMPQRSAVRAPGLNRDARAGLRRVGFVAANLVPRGGVFQGSSAVVSLNDPSDDRSDARPPVYLASAMQVVSFQTGSWDGGYPGSHMGAVSLVRQTLSDAHWWASPGHKEPTPEVFALIGGERGPVLMFDTNHELKILHASSIAREFRRRAVIVGNGTEYKRLAAIARDGNPLVVPLRFPKAPDVSSIGRAEAVELEELMSWEQAPTNPRRLHQAGLKVALTSSKVRNRNDFLSNLREAGKHGLTHDAALAMLTAHPADMLGVSDVLGTIERGKAASLVVMDGPLLEAKSKILDVWTDGRRHEINSAERDDLAGVWELATPMRREPARLTLHPREKKATFESGPEGEAPKLEAKNLKIEGERLSFTLSDDDVPSVIVISAVVQGGVMTGWVQIGNDPGFSFSGGRVAPLPEERKKAEEPEEKPQVPESYGYPFGPYALLETPSQESVVFTNAVLWTAGPRGVIQDGTVAISNGKIVYAGPSASLPRLDDRYRTVDLGGRHITPGIIDTHSHTGTFAFGVNEGTQACTAEVRIADAVDPGHINFYRQLAGGITTVQTLHGSANPIGGQSLTQKIRWGAHHPHDMHFQGAVPGIKFALGENVKQSNWGDRFRTRYPQSRMGVETYIRDRFLAARAYDAARRAGEQPRPDLELEALAEILRGERWIHCHSYRQDEILMLCRMAHEFGFRIGTFQHVLEGYKVAEAIKEAAVGASGFSDWWAFKWEVYDAIPYAFTLMAQAGVNASFNSDSDDLARRMNTESSKAVRYGGLSADDAIKMITINPAIQLGIDRRVGSLEAGKDADLVIWSGDPLSTLSRCEATWIDGREYYSIERDAKLREEVAAERLRITQKLLVRHHKKKKEEPAADTPAEDDTPAPPRRSFAERRLLDQVREEYLYAFERGEDLMRGQCGICGCSHLYDAFMLSNQE